MNNVLTEQSQEALYHIAYNYYRQGKFAHAEEMFRLLTMNQTREQKYWMALGGALQMQKKYREAVDAYYLVYSLDATRYKACFHAAECLFALNEIDQGLNALECAEKAIESRPEPDKNMLAHIVLMKEVWSNNNNHR